MGDVAGHPNAQQMDAMKAHVDEAMRAGAMGIATALIYPPTASRPPTISSSLRVWPPGAAASMQAICAMKAPSCCRRSANPSSLPSRAIGPFEWKISIEFRSLADLDGFRRSPAAAWRFHRAYGLHRCRRAGGHTRKLDEIVGGLEAVRRIDQRGRNAMAPARMASSTCAFIASICCALGWPRHIAHHFDARLAAAVVRAEIERDPLGFRAFEIVGKLRGGTGVPPSPRDCGSHALAQFVSPPTRS